MARVNIEEIVDHLSFGIQASAYGYCKESITVSVKLNRMNSLENSEASGREKVQYMGICT